MDKSITIIVGHFGSGKTEYCVHLALAEKKQGKQVTLCDLDIVNPYFRSREIADFLCMQGIDVISSSAPISNLMGDVPALDARLNTIFDAQQGTFILDVGGDDQGARVLSRFHDGFMKNAYAMHMVLNANRPETQTPAQAMAYIDSIENASRLSVTGIVSNTHMLRETTKEDVLKGARLCEEVCRLRGLPFVCAVVDKSLQDVELCSILKRKLIIDELYLRPQWL